MQLLTTIQPAPEGFSLIHPNKRVLLSGPIVILLRDLEELRAPLANCTERFVGVAVTPGEHAQFVQISALAWHLALPAAELCLIPFFARCLLAAISVADGAIQQAMAAEFKVQRLGRELEMTRRDYNRLTLRLCEQVCELRGARDELGALNEQLEHRVRQRTNELAETNALLSKTLGDLKNAQQELVRAGQLGGLGALVAGVAHELNTPIGNALTMATTLAHETDTLKSQYSAGALKRSALDDYLDSTCAIAEVLERNLVRAADIVCHFKQLSVDRANENRRKFMLENVISDTLSALNPTLRRTPYSVVVEQGGSLEMESYPEAISQILTSLITNALVHAFEGRSEGSIKIYAAARTDERVIMLCSDDGNGIPATKRNHVFDPFYTTKLGQGGSGLGLYIVYNQIYKLLGGHLELHSEEGRGTTFFLDLPRVAPLPGSGGNCEEVSAPPESY